MPPLSSAAARPSSGSLPQPAAAHRDRRTALRWLVAAACAPSLGLTGCAAADRSGRGERIALPSLSDEQTYRLVNRLSWGANEVELARVHRLGAGDYADAQLQAAEPAVLPAAAQQQIDALRIQQTDLPSLVWALEVQRRNADAVASPEGRAAAHQAYQQTLNELAREAATRHLLRALYSPQQLHEQMSWFWLNHFSVYQHKHNLRAMVGDYEERAIRPHALGRYADLLGTAIRHPAMLRYLDNDRNVVGRPNENLARELLELHTLGLDGGYTQRDVQELARVLTGHGLATEHEPERPRPLRRARAADGVRNGLYAFHPARHDDGDKQLLGRTVRGRGAAELDDVIATLAVHPSTARFVCTKLARHWLGDAPAPLVDRMSAAWLAQRGEIRPVLAVLIAAPEFVAAGPGKFKDPMRYLVSAVRACHVDRVVLDTRPLQAWLHRLGEGLYQRPTPDGYPDDEASWSSSGQMATRFEIARALGASGAGLFRSDDAILPRPDELQPQLARPAYRDWVWPLLGSTTRDALAASRSRADWNALYLSAPDFMYA